MAYSIKPLGNYCTAVLIKENEKTQGGIYLPDQAKPRPHFAKILDTGPGMLVDGKMVEVPLKSGDIVCIGKSSYDTIELPDGTDIILFSYGDVYGILTEE